MSPGVLVVGSINRDLTVSTSRIPGPGETVLGSGHFTGPGGKGANQAVAAARLGAGAAMIGRVGDDDAGREVVAYLDAERVSTAGVTVDPVLPTGLAVITLDDAGENSIVVSPGANTGLRPEIVTDAIGDGPAAGVCIAQLEIPLETVVAAAAAFEGLFLLNPAPALALDRSVLEHVDVLVPNLSELGRLAGMSVPNRTEEMLDAVESLTAGRVVVTLGGAGAFVFDRGDHAVIPSFPVEALDTTGCGDAFCAALAVGLGEGKDLFSAARWACAAGAIAATRWGAAPSMPRRDEVEVLAPGL